MDHYSVLGLRPSATKEEVKAAFRKHALRHHPDMHVNSSDAVKKHAEATFKSIKAAFEAIEGANFVYRDARSPGRAGFRRSAYYNPHPSYPGGEDAWRAGYQGSYTRPGYMHFSQRMAAEMRTFWRVFTSSGSATLTAALGGLCIGGIFFLEPLFSSAWERNNQGKLFKSVEEDVIERKRAQLMALQAARIAREAAAAKTAAAAQRNEAPTDFITKEEKKQLPTNESSSSIDTETALLKNLQNATSPADSITSTERNTPPPSQLAAG